MGYCPVLIAFIFRLWLLKKEAMNDAENLERAGQALFGPHWQTELSRMLKLSDPKRLRQWLSGYRDVPPGVMDDTIALLRQRGAEMIALADELAAEREPDAV